MEWEVLKIVVPIFLFSIILTTADIDSDLKLIYEIFTGGFVKCNGNLYETYDQCFEDGIYGQYFPHTVYNAYGEEIVCKQATFKEQCFDLVYETDVSDDICFHGDHIYDGCYKCWEDIQDIIIDCDKYTECYCLSHPEYCDEDFYDDFGAMLLGKCSIKLKYKVQSFQCRSS